MDIVVEPVQEAPAEEVYGATGLDAEPEVPQQQQDSAQEAPPPTKKRGRPPGSKNKPKIIEQVEQPIQQPIPVGQVRSRHGPEDQGQELILEREPKPKRAPRQPRVPKDVPQYLGPTRTPTSLDIAANMLNLLRIEQAERQQ